MMDAYPSKVKTESLNTEGAEITYQRLSPLKMQHKTIKTTTNNTEGFFNHMIDNIGYIQLVIECHIKTPKFQS